MTEKTLPASIETKKKFFTKKRICSILITLFCLCMAVFMLFPMYMIYINSFKNFFQFIIDPLSLPKPWTLKNYEYAVESFNYFRLLLNNLVFESISLFFIVLLGAMAGYTIARRPSRFKRIIYIYIVMGITLPTYTALYPQIRLISDLGLTDTYAGVIVLYVAAGMPMSIFLFNGHFGGASSELEDAAKIDGCSYYRQFFSIFFPLSIATCATLVLVQAVSIWNDTTFTPLVISKDSAKWSLMTQLNTAMGRMIGQGTRWERLYAIAALCMLPMIVLFFFVNRFLIQGVAEGAVKG